MFYALGSIINVRMEENKNEPSGSIATQNYNGSKTQNYSFSLGMGIGKRRNVTPVVSAIRFQERLKQVNMLNGDLSEKSIEDLAQQFYKQSYYSFVHERPDKYFWEDVEKTISNDGITLKDLNMYADAYLRESVNEVRYLRSEMLIAGVNARGEYQNNYYASTGHKYSLNEQFFTLGEAYINFSHQLNLNSQLSFGMALSGGPNILKTRFERNKYSLSGKIGYDYELTDRIVTSLNNEFQLEFVNADKQYRTPRNIFEFSLKYFIEDNLSFNDNYKWNYMVNFIDYAGEYTNNNHTINVGFAYYFEKGFIFNTIKL